jgi:hypothetical protein
VSRSDVRIEAGSLALMLPAQSRSAARARLSAKYAVTVLPGTAHRPSENCQRSSVGHALDRAANPPECSA